NDEQEIPWVFHRGPCSRISRQCGPSPWTGPAPPSSVTVLVIPGVPHHPPGQGAGVYAILQQHLAVDDRVVNALGLLLDAPAATREVGHHRLLAGLHRGWIEDHDVRR